MELDTKKPLTRIKNQDWVWYSEYPLETVKAVWKKKEWLPVGNTVIPYDVYNTTIEEADIADRYIHFWLPEIAKKYPEIVTNLKRKLKNMPRREREELTYAWIRNYVDNQIHEIEYYR